MAGRESDHSDISVVGVARLVGLTVNGLHISINDYNSIKMAIDKVFIQRKDQITAFALLLNIMFTKHIINLHLLSTEVYSAQFSSLLFVFIGSSYILHRHTQRNEI
jgi:hypothetical protein